jgi:sulfate adenylyltransferase (ADP) / ATP adenylyltransferase
MILKKGTLWQSIERTTENALKTGALFPVSTDHTFIEDAGLQFFVRILASLRKKDEARKQQEAATTSGKKVNPFLPPEKSLIVADVTDTHQAILNKFNVVEHHLLIITRHFEDQDTLLTIKDLEALWLCMDEYSSLGFYNGGREAGASQQHKHLQIVPLPLTRVGPAIPIEPLLAGVEQSGITTIPGFPFLHSFVRLDRDLVNFPGRIAEETFNLYSTMLEKTGLNTPDSSRLTLQSMPYCLLIAREWMLLVPRSKEHFEDISFNSLAFAGSLFVQDRQQLARLKTFGPMNALRSVTIPKDK